MLHHPLTIVVAGGAYLLVTGDFVASWLLGLAGERSPRRVLVAMASSLVVHALLLPAPYLWGWLPRLSAAFPALPLALAALSALGWWRAPRRPVPAAPRTPPLALLPAAIVGVLALWPTLAGHDSGYYFSNNGEFANYALLVDVVRAHPAAAPLDYHLGVAGREGATALVLAAVAEPLRVPGILAVEPLSALFAMMFFASLGVLLAARLEDVDAGAGARARPLPLAVLCGGAASASTLQIWTLSFVSQYLSFAILGPLLAAAPLLVGPRGEARRLAGLRGVCVGLAVGALVVLYPDMAPATLAVAAAYVLPVWAARVGWRRSAGTAAVAGVTAGLTPLAAVFLTDRYRTVNVAGWDFFGARDRLSTVWSNLLGFGSLFDPSDAPRAGALVAAALIAVSAVAAALRLAGRSGRTGVRAGLDAALLAWVLASAALFLHVALARVPTNYTAAKFAGTFLWIPILAVAATVAEAREAWRVAASVAVVVTVVAQVATGVRFAARAGREADAFRIAAEDLAAGRRMAGPGPVHLSAPREGPFTLVALALLDGRILPDERGRLLRRDEFQWRGQPWVLRLGPRALRARAARPAGYERVLERPGFELWRGGR
jgi:hypothetical protein